MEEDKTIRHRFDIPDIVPGGVNVWAYLVKLRDNFTCQSCKTATKRLESHHKDTSISKKWSINNGVTLCEACHRATHNNGKENKSSPAVTERVKPNLVNEYKGYKEAFLACQIGQSVTIENLSQEAMRNIQRYAQKRIFTSSYSLRGGTKSQMEQDGSYTLYLIRKK